MNVIEDQKALSVLVIDDEKQIQRLLTVALQAHGCRVSTAATGREGVAAAAERRYDVIVLDLGLPDMNGIQVLRSLREWTATPIVVLTVLDGELEKVESLDSGADDYVTKPFNTPELLARLRATVRRANRGQGNEPGRRFGKLEVDLLNRRVTLSGQPINLTLTEYALLRLFVQYSGRVLTHQQILRAIWGSEFETKTQYLRIYMLRLRKKLEANHAKPELLITEPGVGYRLVAKE